jgi:hypothetical protein
LFSAPDSLLAKGLKTKKTNAAEGGWDWLKDDPKPDHRR